MHAVRRILVGEEAATAVEYAVMLAFILMAMLATIASLGGNTGALWGNSRSQLESHGFK